MTRIIMHGCNGKMGQVISDLVKQGTEAEIVAGIDVNTKRVNSYPVFASLQECDIPADVVIDFSVATIVNRMLETAQEKKLPVVLCTTGLSQDHLERIMRVSNDIPILKSANMSLGINTLMRLLKDVAKTLAPEGFDIEILEKHHNQKIDAPSGTALALADSINQEMGGEYQYVYDRSSLRRKRGKKEMGISAIRGGTIVGEHDVIFVGTDEVVTISHTAYSKAIFGKGAIAAAKYLAGKPAGLYDMSDVI